MNKLRTLYRYARRFAVTIGVVVAVLLVSLLTIDLGPALKARAEKAGGDWLERKMTIRFDANVSKGMPWVFAPVQPTMDVKIGETALAFFRATNSAGHAVKGTAMFNVSPDVVGIYFNKIECFCFKEQTLAAGETVDMPVSFYVDPAIVKDRDAAHIREITLSYTFYPSGQESDPPGLTPGKGAAAVAPGDGRKGS